MNKSKIIKISAICAAGFAALIFLYFICVWSFAFKPTFTRAQKERTENTEIEFYAGKDNYNIHLADSQWFESLNCPLIEITSFDGLKLKAYILEAESDCQGTVLLMHGFHSGPVREFATIAKFFHQKNYNVVMPYQRSHGLSEGTYITFGINERFDCRDWVTKINELYGTDMPVVIGGISMGCATVTMASGFDLPVNVRGFISDCGFTSPYEVVYWTMTKQQHVPAGIAKLLLTTSEWFANKWGGFSFNGYSTITALSHSNKPILFISGTEDNTVPVDMTMTNFLLYKMRGNETSLILFDGCPHAISYLWDSDKYFDAVTEFLNKYCRK